MQSIRKLFIVSRTSSETQYPRFTNCYGKANKKRMVFAQWNMIGHPWVWQETYRKCFFFARGNDLNPKVTLHNKTGSLLRHGGFNRNISDAAPASYYVSMFRWMSKDWECFVLSYKLSINKTPALCETFLNCK